VETSDSPQWQGVIDPKLKETMDSGQLPLFMTPNEILATHRPSEGDRLVKHEPGRPQLLGSVRNHDCTTSGCRMETDDELYDRKLKESNLLHSPPLPESIAQEGVKTPVMLYRYKNHLSGMSIDYIGNGHHRVASAHSVKPDSLIPVSFYD
jgi:hypothetical protein